MSPRDTLFLIGDFSVLLLAIWKLSLVARFKHWYRWMKYSHVDDKEIAQVFQKRMLICVVLVIAQVIFLSNVTFGG